MRASEVDFHIPALIPEQYIPDIHRRLIEYKRIASVREPAALREIEIELVDRFGPLPDALKHLFRITRIKIQTLRLGVEKIDIGEQQGKIVFSARPNIDTARLIELIRQQPREYRFDGKQTLRIACQNDELEPRFRQVENLLAQLSTDK